MSTPESNPTRSHQARVVAFRVLGGVLLACAALGLVALSIGVYYTATDASTSGWFPPVFLGCLGVGLGAMIIIGIRSLRIKSVEELEEQSKSKWIDS